MARRADGTAQITQRRGRRAHRRRGERRQVHLPAPTGQLSAGTPGAASLRAQLFPSPVPLPFFPLPSLSHIPAHSAPQTGLALLPSDSPFHDLPAYIDGEDPNLSSWCRYLNHSDDDAACNVRYQVDGAAALVWFVALRDIGVGEELAWSYDDQQRLSDGKCDAGQPLEWFTNVSLETLFG